MTFDLLLIYIAWAYGLWVLFIFAMAARWAWPRLGITVKALLVLPVLVAVVGDMGLNVMATLPFFDAPRELMFTQRMNRYKKEGGIRGKIAAYICRTFLDPFEQGGHCSQ